MGTDGPSIDAEAQRQEGKMGGVRGTGDVMRDAQLPVREEMEGTDGGSTGVSHWNQGGWEKGGWVEKEQVENGSRNSK